MKPKLVKERVVVSPVSPFFRYLRRLRPTLAPPTSLKEAMTQLRESTGMTREEIARCCFLTTNQFTNLETHGRPLKYATALRLVEVAKEYYFRTLQKYFEDVVMEIKIRHRHSKRQSL